MVHQSVAWTHTHKHTRARTHARTSRCNLESPINVLSMFFDFFMFFWEETGDPGEVTTSLHKRIHLGFEP